VNRHDQIQKASDVVGYPRIRRFRAFIPSQLNPCGILFIQGIWKLLMKLLQSSDNVHLVDPCVEKREYVQKLKKTIGLLDA